MRTRSTFSALATTASLVLLPVVLHPVAARGDSRADMGSAVVKVFSTASPPDLERPWQRASTESTSGSGVILKSGQILTNAHVVSDAVSIDVKRDGATERFSAKVAFIGHASDLALITVDDDAFFKGSRHLDLGVMPRVQDQVTVLGYPTGGESLSITAGVVSRIEIGTYAHSLAELLQVQIDAAINAGNSGGPVVAGERIVGIATQGLSNSQNIGYMVPVPIIRQFLRDADDGHIDGPQNIGVGVQDLESPSHQARYGLVPGETGALVTAVNHGSPAWGVIRPRDVLTAIDGKAIANDLSVASDYGVRLDFTALLSEKQAGDAVELRIVRDGKRFKESVQLHPWQTLVPGPSMSDVARYRVFGGFVFQPLTADYLYIDFEHADTELMNLFLYHNLRTPDRSEVVIVSQVLPGEVSRGYSRHGDEVVARVEGQQPRDFAHLNEIIDSATGRWLEIETLRGVQFVLDLENSRRTTHEILERFAIGDDRSPRAGMLIAEQAAAARNESADVPASIAK